MTNAPLFVDFVAGNLRLQSNSLCINAGNAGASGGDTDLDGRPRIVGGRVDIGAFEYQGPGMSEFIGWLQRYGLPTDGSADFTDPDADRLNSWHEWLCGTDPTNTLSALRMLTPSIVGADVSVRWQSVVGKSYFLERASNPGPEDAFQPLANTIPGQAGTTTFADTNATGAGQRFYRVGVR